MSRALTSTLIVRLLDRLSGPARGATRSIRGLGQAADEASHRAGRAVGAQGGFAALQHSMGRVQRSAASASIGVSAPLAALGRVGAEGAYNYARVGNAVEAVGLLTAEQRKEIEQHTMALNASFPFTAPQILGAAEELLKAGLTFEQTMGSLAGTLQLAQAGDLATGLATDIATNVMTAMRLPMETSEQVEKSLARVNDVLAYAATRSNASVEDFGQTMKYVAPIAAGLGMSLEEVAGAAMIMANNGIKGSESGVALRSGLARMVRPVKPMVAALARLNVNLSEFVELGEEVKADDLISSLFASGINASEMHEQIETILDDDILRQAPARLVERLSDAISTGLGSDSIVDREALADSISGALAGSAKRVDFLGFMRELRAKGATDADMFHVFDQRQGSRLATTMAGDMDEAVATLLAKAPGAAAAMAEARMKGIVGSVNRWNSALTNSFIAIAESGVMDEVASGLDRTAAATTRLGESNPAMLKFGTYALGALAVVGPLGFALGGVASAASLLGSVISVPLVAIKGLGTWAGTAATSAIGLQSALASMDGRSYGNLGKAKTAFVGIARAIPGVSMLAGMGSGFAAAVAALSAPAWGAIALGVAAVGAAGFMVWRYWDRLSAVFGGVARALGDQLAPAIEAVKPYFEWLKPIGNMIAAGWDRAKSAIQSFGTWMGSFFTQETLNEGQKAEWGAFGYALGTELAENVKTAIGKLIEWFTTVPRMIMSAIGSIDLGSIIKWPRMPAWLGGFGGEVETEAAIDGARARGGPVSAGGTYLVGEEGPELFTPARGGRVIPNDDTMAMLRGGEQATSTAPSLSPTEERPEEPTPLDPRPPANVPSDGSSGMERASQNGRSAAQPAAPVFNTKIYVSGVSDPKDAAEEVMRQMSNRLRFSLRGSFSDY